MQENSKQQYGEAYSNVTYIHSNVLQRDKLHPVLNSHVFKKKSVDKPTASVPACKTPLYRGSCLSYKQEWTCCTSGIPNDEKQTEENHQKTKPNQRMPGFDTGLARGQSGMNHV